MSIKNAKYNYHNGTDFDTFHYETSAKQVKVLGSNGDITSDLEELLLKGKLIESKVLDSVKDTGMYLVKNCFQTPLLTPTKDAQYPFSVENTGLVTKQSFFDMENDNFYVRGIYNGKVGEWMPFGKITTQQLNDVIDAVGLLSALVTNNKTSLVGAINELRTDADNHEDGIAEIVKTQSDMKLELDKHKDAYVSKANGGNFEKTVSVSNGQSIGAKNTSGNVINLGKVNEANKIVFGDKTLKAVFEAINGDFSVSDGTKEYQLFHAGNMGSGSKLDADMVDGIEGSKLSRLDIENIFKSNQTIGEGSSLSFRALNGSQQAGSILFKGGDGTVQSKITPVLDGGIAIFSNNINSHTFRADGTLFSNQNHVLQSPTNGEVQLNMKKDSSDKGIGFVIGSATGTMSLYDWENTKRVMEVKRDNNGMANFPNAMMIQGRRVYIQASAPTVVGVGDIWFDI